MSAENFLNENLYTILNLMKDGIILTDKNSIVLYINPAFEIFSGLKMSDIVGKYWHEVRLGAVLPKVLETKTPIYNLPRKVENVESYCDLIPLIIDGELIGGMVVVKDVLSILDLLKELEESHKRIIYLDERIKASFKATYTFDDVIGKDNGLKKIIDISYKASQSNSPILLVGESGTGKEVLAQSIHNASSRSEGPFVDINCSAIPENLLESELFGYDAGAFTGANKAGKLGLFEIASGGTIFLDEITEMPLQLQTKLLRVIQEKRILKIGGERYIDIDIRVIGATNKDINKRINDGKFRDDLYFRLAVFVINIPPLRERKDDIKLFANRFVQDQIRDQKRNISIDKEVVDLFYEYEWPGNVREMKNVIEYSANVTDDYVIKLSDLPLTLLRNIKLDRRHERYAKGNTLEDYVFELEKEIIINSLKIYGSNLEAKKLISENLGISIATLYNKMKKYEIES